jgi:HEAT repeat protein
MTGNKGGSTASRGGSGQESDQANDGPPNAEYTTGIDAEDPSTRRQAVKRVTGAVENDDLSPSAAVDILGGAVRDDDPAVRVAVCEALGAAGTEAAKDELDRLRVDPDSDVSRAATRVNRHFE